MMRKTNCCGSTGHEIRPCGILPHRGILPRSTLSQFVVLKSVFHWTNSFAKQPREIAQSIGCFGRALVWRMTCPWYVIILCCKVSCWLVSLSGEICFVNIAIRCRMQDKCHLIRHPPTMVLLFGTPFEMMLSSPDVFKSSILKHI